VDPTRVWPDFDDAWIVHADDDLVVVNKPDTMATQSADPDLPDDLVMRVKRHLGASYLGVHQRLDRDTSGVLVLARRREANPSLAAQFEGRRVRKRYLACVERWPAARGKATLRDVLAPGDDGRMRVVDGRARDRKGQIAVTHVRVVRRVGQRTLLELELETGRTHQARVQLAHAGAPIAGDALYGGAHAPRLLLHAESIALEHPTHGEPVRYAAKVPPEFDDWLAHGDRGEGVYDDADALERALRRAVARRFALGRSSGARATTAFRVVNESGDALPQLAVDVYGAHVVAQLYGLDGAFADAARRERLFDALSALGFDGVYLKVRPKQANVIVDARRDDLAPRAPVRGVAAPDEFAIVEEGVAYRVRLGDGLSTGIFLDQRANRRRVREIAAAKSVLNLFAYTCAFSVAAAFGGATRTVSVDAAAAALERGRANLESAGLLARGEHTFVAQDAFAWLARAKAKGERFDLVLLDPPSYSSTKRRRFSAESDYAELAALALALVRPGGRLLACTNHRGIRRGKFRRVLADAVARAGRAAAQIKDLPDPHDFPTPPGDESHLKSVLVTLSN
jgi:23S rRNA (cytosine1962-C5)-methyltransferase